MSKTTSAELKRLTSVISEAKERNAEYGKIEKVVVNELAYSEAGIKRLTPLPRISHDKDTMEKLKSLRTKHDNIRKSAKHIATTCKQKRQSLLVKVDGAEKKMSKMKSEEAKKKESVAKKSSKGKKRV